MQQLYANVYLKPYPGLEHMIYKHEHNLTMMNVIILEVAILEN